jgi:hypothetical protein
VELINLFLCLYVIMVRCSSAYACSYSSLPFPCTDEVFALACSPTDALLVASRGKDDKGFLWRIGSAEDALELTGMACFLSLLLCFCMQYDGNISAQHKLRYSPPYVFIFEEHIYSLFL